MRRAITSSVLVIAVILITSLAWAMIFDTSTGVAVTEWGYVRVTSNLTSVADTIRDYQVEQGWRLVGESGNKIDGSMARLELRGTTTAGYPVTFEAITESGEDVIVRVRAEDEAVVRQVTADVAKKLGVPASR